MVADCGAMQVSGHDFSRAEQASACVNTRKNAVFLTAVGERAAPVFGAERPKKSFFRKLFSRAGNSL